jgi:hypothetical protein
MLLRSPVAHNPLTAPVLPVLLERVPPDLVRTWPGKEVVGCDQAFLAGAREVNPDAWTSRAAQLPTGRIEACRGREVAGLGDLDAVGEAEALPASSRKSEEDLAARLEVIGVLVE